MLLGVDFYFPILIDKYIIKKHFSNTLVFPCLCVRYLNLVANLVHLLKTVACWSGTHGERPLEHPQHIHRVLLCDMRQKDAVNVLGMLHGSQGVISRVSHFNTQLLCADASDSQRNLDISFTSKIGIQTEFEIYKFTMIIWSFREEIFSSLYYLCMCSLYFSLIHKWMKSHL